jgi:hypothetical protein
MDDIGHLEGDETKLIKYVTFHIAGGRPKARAGQYVRANNLSEIGFRAIALSTSEDPPWQAVTSSGRRRIRGEEVRLINIRACVSERGDIFDGNKADAEIGSTVEERIRFVEKQEAFTLEYQGEPFRAYLTERFKDVYAKTTLKRYYDEFLSRIPSGESRAFGRIRKCFAITYASAAQAIHYGILPWHKEATLKDIAKCMSDAIDQLSASFPSASAVPETDDALVADFKERIKTAKWVRPKTASVEELKGADGIIRSYKRGKIQYLLYGDRLAKWFPETSRRKRLTAALELRRMLMPGRRSDTRTIQVSVAALDRRIPCYRILRKRLTD